MSNFYKNLFTFLFSFYEIAKAPTQKLCINNYCISNALAIRPLTNDFHVG